LRFIDSYKFLNISFDKLASFLSKDKLRILQREFSKLSVENFNLLTRKGIFPYEYIDCVQKLDKMCLPSRESFYSSLTGDTVSESNYAHAANVWQRFSIRTLGEYSDLYLKTDVLLLADIFENFHDSCVASYGLDPAYYYTLPSFTWDVMLKHVSISNCLPTSTWSCSSNVVYAAIWVNVPTDMRESTTSTCCHTIHRNHRRILCVWCKQFVWLSDVSTTALRWFSMGRRYI